MEEVGGGECTGAAEGYSCGVGAHGEQRYHHRGLGSGGGQGYLGMWSSGRGCRAGMQGSGDGAGMESKLGPHGPHRASGGEGSSTLPQLLLYK